MNSRILRSIWKLNGLRLAGQIKPIASRRYAIPVKLSSRLSGTNFAVNYSSATNTETKEKTSNLEQALNRLQTDFTAHGNVHPNNFQKLLNSLEPGSQIPTEQSVFLLEACADLMPSQTPESKIQLFEKLWDHIKANGDLKRAHYLALLKVYAANDVKLKSLREFLEESGTLDDRQMYEKVIEYACELGDIKMATEIIGEMKAKNFPLTENVFNALIMGHSKKKDIKGALAVVDTMNAAGVELSSTSYAQLVAAHITDSNFERATMIVQQHTGNFGLDQTVRLMKLLAMSPLKGAMQQDLMELLTRQLPADYLFAKEVPHLLRNVCTELIFKERIEEAYFIIKALPVPKFMENQDSDTYGVSFLQDLFRSKTNYKQIISFAKDLIDSGKNLRALHIACDSAMRRNPEQAIPYLKTLSESEPLRCHYFWPLLLHKFRNNGEAGIFRALKTMSSLGVDCDYETMSSYVLPRLSVTLEDPLNAIKTLENCGLKTSQMLTPIIAHLIFQQNLDEVIKIAKLYTSRLDTREFVQPLTNLATGLRTTKRYEKFSNAMHTLHLKSDDPKRDFVGQVLVEIISNSRMRNDAQSLRRIISYLSKLQARISSAASEILGSHIAKQETGDELEDIRKMLITIVDRKLSLPSAENTGSQIIHPRDMDYEQLECHLVEMEAKGLNTRGVLRRLLQMCIREGRLERAVQVKEKCEAAKVTMSPGMMASLFDLYIRLSDSTAAEACYKQISKTYPGFLLDEHKIIDFSALLVRQGKLEEAKKLLSDRAASRKVFGGDYVVKNVWNLLTNVAQHAAKDKNLPTETNLTKDFFYFLKNLGFCNSHNTVIGPIIREYIYRKDIRAALNEFKRLAEAFRHTPLQFELMSILVGLSNSNDPLDLKIEETEAKTLLQQLTATVAGIHGQINMNSSLLLAIAESGTENQLRKVLINPEFRINQDMLQQNCEHLNEEGCIDTLLKLAKACRGLGHVLKEQDVYDLLLSKYIRDNNFQASMQLYGKLEVDDDLKMSQEFLKKLVDLLKVNKIDIPSSLALRAQIM